ncbi:hypothetical protein CMUS01_10574 [Colletotrichum musicola]|uniref:DUF6604 domain-containing protein n=1 Tax=Colletotrichum musicola TaxID=2175873 RepID=A0A8H6K218_9PEZI|nr:hypothetical protein CMUS01_10574 [Colletotrichum musicola]
MTPTIAPIDEEGAFPSYPPASQSVPNHDLITTKFRSTHCKAFPAIPSATMSQQTSPASTLPPAIQQQYLRYKNSTNGFINWLFDEAKHHMNPGLTFLERAIDLRRQVSSWYAGGNLAAGHNMRSELDDRHRYFNDRLQIILDMFRGPTATQVPAASATAPTTTRASALSVVNQFSHLHLEGDDDNDTDADVQQTAPSLLQTLPAPDRAHERVKDLVEDPCIELICLLNEMKDIRTHVRWIWRQSLAAKIDIISAGFVTEAAFEWIAIMDEDFCSRNPTLKTWDAMIHHVFRTTVFRCPEEHIKLHLDRDGDGLYVQISDPDQQAIHDDDRLKYLVGKRLSDLDTYQLLQTFEKYSESLSEEVYGVSVWRLDRLTLCLSKGQRKDSIRLATAVMVSIWLDLHEDGVFSAAGNDYWFFSQRYPHAFYGIEGSDTTAYSEVYKDHMQSHMEMLRWVNINHRDPMKGFFQMNPFLAGITLFDAYQRVQDAIFTTVSMSWGIVPMAHIYNHARLRGRWRKNWDDMEAVMAMQEKEVFSPPRPTDFEQEQDASIYREMKDRRFPRKTPAMKNEFMTKLSTWHRWRTIRDKKNDTSYRRQLDPTPILSSVWHHCISDANHGRFIISQSGISGIIKDLVDDCFRENGDTPPRDLTVPQLLDGLLAVVQCEVPHVFFDFWRMNKLCDTLHFKYQCLVTGESPASIRSVDLDKNLLVDLYFKAHHRKLPEQWVRDPEMKTNFVEDWRDWCKKAALFPQNARCGWPEKYKPAIKARMSLWNQGPRLIPVYSWGEDDAGSSESPSVDV